MPAGIVTQLLLVTGLDVHDDLASICAAGRADMMDQVILATIFAAHKFLERQRVMGTAATLTTAGMAFLWQWTHDSSP